MTIQNSFNKSRRHFLKNNIIAGSFLGISGINSIAGCTKIPEEEISPTEDLMREHGVLNRILLIYDFCIECLTNDELFALNILYESALIIRNFIEDYHEKLEENFLFPRFEKANQLTDLIIILRQQHMAGRILTNQIINISKSKSLTTNEKIKLMHLLKNFNSMYRPHEAREDTVLFPALKKIVSSNEYDSLGEDFEKTEQQLFGKNGFESIVDQVAKNEKLLGIYDLSKFTPQPTL